MPLCSIRAWGCRARMGWMSDALLAKMRFAIEEAQRRGMWVILYDEGMYPSGSASGQVVAENPAYQCRGLVRIDLDAAQPGSVEQGVAIGGDGQPALTPDQTLVAIVAYQGRRYAIIDRPIDSVIRGLHFINEDSDDRRRRTSRQRLICSIPMRSPPSSATATSATIRRSANTSAARFRRSSLTSRTCWADRAKRTSCRGRRTFCATSTTSSATTSRLICPRCGTTTRRNTIGRDYLRAVDHRLEATYYAQLYQWCESHHIALTGHPAEPDATTHPALFSHSGAGHRLALYRAGSALGAGRTAVHAGESGVERDAARRSAAQRQRVLRRVWRLNSPSTRCAGWRTGCWCAAATC